MPDSFSIEKENKQEVKERLDPKQQQPVVTGVRGETKRYLSHLFYYNYFILLKSVCPSV